MNISLQSNAVTFFEEAVRESIHAESNPIRWKYAILHLVQSIELSLKERLYRENSLLIFSYISEATYNKITKEHANFIIPKHLVRITKNDRTLSLSEAKNLLKELEIYDLSNVDKQALDFASNLRNQIVHYEFTLTPKKQLVNFVKLFGFLNHFYISQLNVSLRSIVKKDLYNKVLSYKKYIDELETRANDIFDEGNYDYSTKCPNCYKDTYFFDHSINECLVCGHSEEVVECEKCGTYILKSEAREIPCGEDYYNPWCRECFDGDAWATMCHEKG